MRPVFRRPLGPLLAEVALQVELSAQLRPVPEAEAEAEAEEREVDDLVGTPVDTTSHPMPATNLVPGMRCFPSAAQRVVAEGSLASAVQWDLVAGALQIVG